MRSELIEKMLYLDLQLLKMSSSIVASMLTCLQGPSLAFDLIFLILDMSNITFMISQSIGAAIAPPLFAVRFTILFG